MIGWRVIYTNSVGEERHLGPYSNFKPAYESAFFGVMPKDKNRPFVYYGLERRKKNED